MYFVGIDISKFKNDCSIIGVTTTNDRFLYFHGTRIIKTISKGVVLIISPFLKSYIAGVATCSIIRTSTADLYFIGYSSDCLEVTQTAVVCLNW